MVSSARAGGRRCALLRRLVLAVLMAGAGLPATTIVQAAPPTPAGGSLVQALPPVVRDVRAAGGTTIILHTLTLAATGTFTGTLVADERYVIHPEGVTTYQAEATFTGSVDGRAGTFAMRYAGRGDAATFPGHFVILRGLGGLATLRGRAPSRSRRSPVPVPIPGRSMSLPDRCAGRAEPTSGYRAPRAPRRQGRAGVAGDGLEVVAGVAPRGAIGGGGPSRGGPSAGSSSGSGAADAGAARDGAAVADTVKVPAALQAPKPAGFQVRTTQP